MEEMKSKTTFSTERSDLVTLEMIMREENDEMRRVLTRKREGREEIKEGVDEMRFLVGK